MKSEVVGGNSGAEIETVFQVTTKKAYGIELQ